MVPNKRGQLLSLALARLRKLSPGIRIAGLSATVADAKPLIDYLTPQHMPGVKSAKLIRGKGGAKPQVDVMGSEERIPWSGHSGRHSFMEVYSAIQNAGLTLVFVNTRSQAEATFAALWRLNDDGLPIALHHGSLEVGQRRKVEAAMAAGKLRAVVCTSTLDLGIDWGDVDLVIQMGAPKGASRLTQRIGRANHRMNEPSRAVLVPANRMEVLECIAAKQAIDEGALDGEPPRDGALDVLAQHILGMACAAPFYPDELFEEVRSAAPYAALSRKDFDDAVVATVGERTITLADVDDKLRQTNMNVFQELYNARRGVLGELVAEMLLAAEAEKRGVSVDELVEEEISARVEPVTDEEVQAFYDQNRARLGGQTLEQIGGQIRDFMVARNEQAARQSFIDGLRGDSEVVIALDPPRVPIEVASNERIKGSEDAAVTIVEYSDFQ